ncbi:MAG TPA: FtsQ-type POTRA domain-containing protein [Streptosporangiaceae bacterium]|nr:FtsQ-type POTRA domain-containing protein [Streptosporangiaceae bacterium]
MSGRTASREAAAQAGGSKAGGSKAFGSKADGQRAGAPRPSGRLAQSRWRAVFVLLAAGAIVIAIAWALLGSRFFVVRTVQVTGTHLVTPSAVIAAADVPPGTPMIRVNGAAVAQRVEQIRQVQSATVTRNWPGTVVIAVRERTPALAVAAGTGFQLIDQFGVAVESASRLPQGMPQLAVQAGSGPVWSLRGNPAVRAAVAVLHELPRRIARSVRVVQAPGPAEITVELRGGVTIVWGGTDRAAAKAKELAILMHTRARSYDVSAPKMAVTSG